MWNLLADHDTQNRPVPDCASRSGEVSDAKKGQRLAAHLCPGEYSVLIIAVESETCSMVVVLLKLRALVLPNGKGLW